MRTLSPVLKRTVEGYPYEEFKYCTCGCQKTTPKFDTRGRPRNYVRGHGFIGHKLSEEHKKRISLANKGENHPNFGKPISEEIKNKLRKALTGRTYSEETKKRMSEGRRGMKFSEEHRKNLSKSHIGLFIDEKHPAWKGDNVGYYPLHRYVRKRFPKPKLCMLCNKKPPRDLANITGIYNRELRNWAWFCVSCHKEWDNIGVRVAIIRKNNKLPKS